MKVILNEDVKSLGELGDVKVVADGYARNYLFPHRLAVAYNEANIAKFEARKEEIEARKEAKRQNAASLKDKLEGATIELAMPAGANGKLYGAVTSATLADYFAKQGDVIERKRIEIPGLTIKTTGSYHFTVHLYEATTAEVKLLVKAQSDSAEAAEEKKPEAEKENAAE